MGFLKKQGLKESDLVELVSEKQTFIGTILPSNEKNTVFLKLKSGYNIGIETSKISSIKKLSAGQKVAKAKQETVKQDSNLPKISILHTGGTIASRVDYRTGAVYSAFTPKDLLAMFPELAKIGNFNSKLISNMWSDDLRFAHFGVIAKAVQGEAKKGAKGIILGMGTDNLAVAAAAMAFVLEKCPIPVIIVGAQRSSDRGSSDAAMNLVCAAEFIAKTDFAGVAICMHDSSSDNACAILPACKTRKMHTSRRDAFKPVNDTVIAKIDYNSREIIFLKKDYARKSSGTFVLKPKFEEKVGLLKITINMFPSQFEFFSKHGFKGLVIEGTGLGQTPGHMPDAITKKAHKKIFPAIKALAKKSVVVMTSQCLYGRVQMHVYDKATDLVEMGVIPGEDMLPETAFVKLAWLLGNYKNKEKVKELMRKNLRGEITESTIPNQEQWQD
ncbi:MAG: Glu-tRNA(Gln) amidotransferase subunit GatD [Candidatus Diapherotrites archaeon]|nr:Glu-tRNA(Gln) amidotransferase subunit GatD [Candidatus Diapherotrites archaeon]